MAAKYLLSVSILLIFFCTKSVQLHLRSGDDHSTIRCRESERRALLGFRQGLRDRSHRLASWTGQDCCRWAGIGCDNVTGHVVRVDLRNTPPISQTSFGLSFGYLGGEISPSLLALKRLTYLDLSMNNMNGSRIPRFMGSFKRLRHLDLSDTGFQGTVPHELGNLHSLNHLDLSCLYLRFCELEVDDASWLSGFTSLQQLDMSSVNFSKASNWLQALNQLPKLNEVSLSSCQLPRVSFSLHPFNFTSLTALDLSYNADLFRDGIELGEALPRHVRNTLEELYLSLTGLSGRIPDWLGELKSLNYLFLSENSFSGPVPASLGSLSSLFMLVLTDNFLEGVLSEIHFANLTNLYYLDFSYNPSLALSVSPSWNPPFRLQVILMHFVKLGPQFPAWIRTQETCSEVGISNAGISDGIPGWFWNFSTQIEIVDASYNEISGEVRHFTSKDVSTVDLSHNLLSGPIPPSTGEKMPNLESFYLSYNNITGTIPLSLCKLKTLTTLDLSNNHLLGDLPNSWDYASKLKYFDVSSNNLSGHIPDSICSARSLRSLHLESNSLFGNIPPSLRNCEALLILDVSENSLSGNIPAWMGKSLHSLKILQLHSNLFTGAIPRQLSNLSALQILDLSHNNLSGEIPKSFGNFSAMKVEHQIGVVAVNETYYTDSMLLATKGMEQEYGYQLLSLIVTIDLSENSLAGNIPEELGNLIALKSLNLSGNYLIGNIIEGIGRLKQLESLDLSRNELSGAIPSSLISLNFLEHLNLSYNKLSGEIPSGNQLQTLDDPSIYVGNLDLCGFPLIKKCGVAEAPQVPYSTDEDDEGSQDLWFYIGMATGFVLGSWIVWGIFFWKKAWRIAYFRFIDNMYDKIYVTVVLNITRLKINTVRLVTG